MTVENLIIASYIISTIFIGLIAFSSYNAMRKAEDILQDLKDKP